MVYAINALPSPENFIEEPFPQELAPPEIDPDEGVLLVVAYNPLWTPVLLAACDSLRQYTTWQGDSDAKKLAFDRATALKDLLHIPYEVPVQEYPAPYWDDETDVELEEPVETQEWYGQVSNSSAAPEDMTFSQNAVIWLLTGFVAITTLETGPGAIAAAIAFRTLATRFVLAFNRGDIREQFRVIIDAKDYETVDTGDLPVGGITELTINGLDDAANHDILIVVTNPA